MSHFAACRGRRAALLLAALAAACGAPERRPPATEGATEGADALTGVWTARLVVSTPLVGRADSAAVQGTVTLLRDDRRVRVPGLAGPPTHVGAHTLHLGAFGFDPPPDLVPGVVGRWIAPDSVKMAFQLAGPDQRFTLRGRLAGDSIVGRWHYSGHATGGAAGGVVMRRTR